MQNKDQQSSLNGELPIPDDDGFIAFSPIKPNVNKNNSVFYDLESNNVHNANAKLNFNNGSTDSINNHDIDNISIDQNLLSNVIDVVKLSDEEQDDVYISAQIEESNLHSDSDVHSFISSDNELNTDYINQSNNFKELQKQLIISNEHTSDDEYFSDEEDYYANNKQEQEEEIENQVIHSFPFFVWSKGIKLHSTDNYIAISCHAVQNDEDDSLLTLSEVSCNNSIVNDVNISKPTIDTNNCKEEDNSECADNISSNINKQKDDDEDEKEVVEEVEEGMIQEIVVISASSGTEHCVIPRHLIADFILCHSTFTFIYHHHSSFPFDVICWWLKYGDDDFASEHEKANQKRRNSIYFNIPFSTNKPFRTIVNTSPKWQQAYDLWWELMNSNSIRNIAILDLLIRLGLRDVEPQLHDLPTITKRYLIFIDPSLLFALSQKNRKEASYRDMLHINGSKWWEAIDASKPYLNGSITTSLAIVCAYRKMQLLAKRITQKHARFIVEGSDKKFGLLSEAIQVKCSVALAAMRRNGFCVDLNQRNITRNRLLAQLNSAVDAIQALPKPYCELLIHDGVGGTTSKHKRLEKILVKARVAIIEKTKEPFDMPLNERGQISVSTKRWRPYAEDNAFIKAWVDMERAAKLLQFCNLHEINGITRAKYRLMVRNGRTSCSRPNIQQMPRNGGFREIFHASKGHVLLLCDYSFIELCTLAVVCEKRFGFSMLANVIRNGIDPHAYTASIFEGMELDEFMKLKTSSNKEDKEKYSSLRQRAKAINFGIPGGEGALALQEYALSAYGVTITLDESKKFREMLIRKVYPELSLYLFEDCMDVLAQRLRVPVERCWNRFNRHKTKKSKDDDNNNDEDSNKNFAIGLAIRNVIEGKKFRKDGKPYQQRWITSIWRALLDLCKNPILLPMIEDASGIKKRDILRNKYLPKSKKLKISAKADCGSIELCRQLFGNDVTTTTGRIRGNVTFTQGCNTPFSGLAADGAKLAMFNLMHVGYRLIAFIHDEVILELPEHSNFNEEANMIDYIMCHSMKRVCNNIPIKCEYAITKRWSKKAEAVYDQLGNLKLWQPTD